MRISILGVLSALILFTGCAVLQPNRNVGVSQTVASQPQPPVSGPGSPSYPYYTVRLDHQGSGNNEYWIFYPDVPAPTSPLPLVVFLHGWGAYYPDQYNLWVRHLCQKGAVVVFPRFQLDLSTSLNTLTPNAQAALVDALSRIKAANVKLTKTYYVGHSIGGFIAANLAATQVPNCPPAVGLFLADPCDGVPGTGGTVLSLPVGNLANIPSGVKIFAVLGDADNLAKPTDIRQILSGAKNVPSTNKQYFTLHSDTYGSPVLTADHAAPLAVSADTLDYYGFFKWSQAIIDANVEYLTGQSSVFMGKWSDGVPVSQPTVNAVR